MFDTLNDASSSREDEEDASGANLASRESSGRLREYDDDFFLYLADTTTAKGCSRANVMESLQEIEEKRLASMAMATETTTRMIEEQEKAREAAVKGAADRRTLRAGITPALQQQLAQEGGPQAGARTTAAAVGAGGTGVGDASAAEVVVVAATRRVPVTTYLTPPSLLSRRLIFYNREKHLMPHIQTFARQVCHHLNGVFPLLLMMLTNSVSDYFSPAIF